LRQIAPLLYF
jgi:glycoprotein 2-beta-D-xylosyltransferase